MAEQLVESLSLISGQFSHDLWKIKRSEGQAAIDLNRLSEILRNCISLLQMKVLELKELLPPPADESIENNNYTDDSKNGDDSNARFYVTSTELPSNAEIQWNGTFDEDGNMIVQHNNTYYKVVNAINQMEDNNETNYLEIQQETHQVEQISAEEEVTTTQELINEDYMEEIPEETPEETPEERPEETPEETINKSIKEFAEETVKNSDGQLIAGMFKKGVKESVKKTSKSTNESHESRPKIKRPKRKCSIKPEVEMFLKRRRSMDMSLISSTDTNLLDDEEVTPVCAPKKSKESKEFKESMKSKMKKAMKKRMSRTTICIPRPELNEDDQENDQLRQNTDAQMHAMNELYKTLCMLCNVKNTNLVSHYVNKHPLYEVPISRPTPEMATQLRQKPLDFDKKKNKITGDCMFCKEKKIYQKKQWELHLIAHTGEKQFACKQCDQKLKIKSEHDKKCDGKAVNIFHESSGDMSLIAFICKDCNYTQFWRNNIIKHMENEHGYTRAEEKYHYEKVTVIPAI